MSRKRRTRSPAHEKMLAPSNMTLRKKAKTDYKEMIRPGKVSKEDPEEEEKEDKLTFAMPGEVVKGASYVRYEVLEKKGSKILVPVRYSIRNQNLDTTFHTKEAIGAHYKPCEMESMFSMSDTAQQTAMLLRSKIVPKLQPEDFA